MATEKLLSPNGPTFIVQASPDTYTEFYFSGREKRSVANGLIALMQAGVTLGHVDEAEYASNAVTLTDARTPILSGPSSEQILIKLVMEPYSDERTLIERLQRQKTKNTSNVRSLSQALTARDVTLVQDENVHILNYDGYGLTADEQDEHLTLQTVDIDELIGEVPPSGVIAMLPDIDLEAFHTNRDALTAIYEMRLHKAAFQYPIIRSYKDQKADPLAYEATVYGKLDYFGKFVPRVTELPQNYFND